MHRNVIAKVRRPLLRSGGPERPAFLFFWGDTWAVWLRLNSARVTRRGELPGHRHRGGPVGHFVKRSWLLHPLGRSSLFLSREYVRESVFKISGEPVTYKVATITAITVTVGLFTSVTEATFKREPTRKSYAFSSPLRCDGREIKTAMPEVDRTNNMTPSLLVWG